MDSLAEQIIVDVLTREMSMPENSVWIRDQNRKIPNDDGLYLVVGMVSSVPQSSQTFMKEVVTPQPSPAPPVVQMVEVQEVQMCENIQIDIFSRSNAAIRRQWEVMAALKSFYCQQRQEQNYFKIFRNPTSILNLSSAEGSSQLNRFGLSFPCFVWYRKERSLTPNGGDWYDDFTTRVDDANTIGTEAGLFEFNIAAEE